MASAGTVYRFGPFELDAGHRRLRRGLETLTMPDRHLEVLLCLAANAGEIVSKDVLLETAWRDVAVTDSSLIHAIGRLRTLLDGPNGGPSHIENLPRRGYRFTAAVARGQPRQEPVALDTLLAPYRSLVDGRAALEALNRDDIILARAALRDAVQAMPDDPAAQIGLANACVLLFESTRADVESDAAALDEAERSADRACHLDSASADAWSTAALVRHRLGNTRDAIAAARRAIALSPRSWQHHLRLAAVSWGEQRVDAARHALTLCPGLAFAHWFAATVFVARQAFEHAGDALAAGCAAQDAAIDYPGAPFRGVGLYFLDGLVRAAQGDVEGALQSLARELTLTAGNHVYARECCANSWYAIGGLRLRLGCRADAAAAFKSALTHLPRHPQATIGLAAVSGSPSPPAVPNGPVTIELAIAQAAVLALQERHDDAARVCREALAQQPPGSAGWLIPVDPLLHVTAHPEAWARTLNVLRTRAL